MLKSIRKNDIPEKFRKFSRNLEQILEKFRNFDENFPKETYSFFQIFVSRPSSKTSHHYDIAVILVSMVTL